MMLVMMTALISGCSKNPMESTETNQSSGPQLLQRNPGSVSGAQLSGPTLYTEQIVSSLSGATMVLYDVTLIVPPLAVSNDTLFSISIPDADLFYNEFGTSGLQFNVPVTVIMNYRDADLTGIDESTIRLAWYDEYYQSWRDMNCTVDQINKCVTGQLDHFSSYGLISD
jgi:hypothetical protein